jgi:hypothetical protein
MQKMNQQATGVFDALALKTGWDTVKKFTAPEFMPLVMALIARGEVETPMGIGDLYSLAHYLPSDKGQRLHDPLMFFIALRDLTDQHIREIYPMSMMMEGNAAVSRKTIFLVDGKLVSVDDYWQHDQTRFANQWMKNIKQQGFLR